MNRRACRLLLSILISSPLLQIGCRGSSDPTRVEALLHADVSDGQGAPVEGALVRLEGLGARATDPGGNAVMRISGRAGDVVKVAIQCPPGSLKRGETEAPVILGAAASLDGGVAMYESRATCVASHMTVPLVVRAKGRAGLPVSVAGRPVATLDAEGVAHVLIEAEAGEDLEVAIDTTGVPSLLPRSPTYVYHIGDHPEILIVDQRFESKNPLTARAPRKPRGPKRL